MNNIIVQDVGAEVDAITQLRAPTHFGRPNVSCFVLPPPIKTVQLIVVVGQGVPIDR
jgi:hypothetical protein